MRCHEHCAAEKAGFGQVVVRRFSVRVMAAMGCVVRFLRGDEYKCPSCRNQVHRENRIFCDLVVVSWFEHAFGEEIGHLQGDWDEHGKLIHGRFKQGNEERLTFHTQCTECCRQCNWRAAESP